MLNNTKNADILLLVLSCKYNWLHIWHCTKSSICSTFRIYNFMNDPAVSFFALKAVLQVTSVDESWQFCQNSFKHDWLYFCSEILFGKVQTSRKNSLNFFFLYGVFFNFLMCIYTFQQITSLSSSSLQNFKF